MAVAEDLGPGAGDADERIVLGHAAVRIQPDHLAVILAQILGAIALPALADGDEQMALRVERETRAEVFARAHERLGREDHLEVLEPAVAQPGARDAGAVAAVAFGRIGEIDHAVRRRTRDRGRHRAARPARSRTPPARPRSAPGSSTPVAHDAHPPGTLGDQDAPVRAGTPCPTDARGRSRPCTSRNVACSELIGLVRRLRHPSGWPQPARTVTITPCQGQRVAPLSSPYACAPAMRSS